MFKRRNPKSYGERARNLLWPKGGWTRAGKYLMHRIRRLPDQPHRIARGIAVGIFISFTPFFGFHLVGAAALAWLVSGNVVAALFGTFVGNPVTIPLIAALSVGLGRRILHTPGVMSPNLILGEFTSATSELYDNLIALFTGGVTHWTGLHHFYDVIFLPYLVGGIVPGLIAAAVGHMLTLPVLKAYHRRRTAKMAARLERLSRIAEGSHHPAPNQDKAASHKDGISGPSL